MPETEVLYSDVKFTKKKGDTTETASSSIEATYSEVKISKTQPSTELPECSTASQQAVSNGGSKVKSLKVALVILCVLLAVVVIALCYVYYDHMQTKEMYQTLTAKYKDLKKNVTDHDHMQIKKKYQSLEEMYQTLTAKYIDLEKNFTDHDHMQTKKKYQTLEERHQTLTAKYKDLEKNFTETLSRKVVPPSCPQPPEIKPNDSCPKCDKDWEQHGGKCYYFSITTSSWEESRRYCQSHGGDLVKIDSRDEQIFLTKELSDKMNDAEDKFWIGLTDSKKEGKWFWVDDSPLNTSLSFWREDEPDNWEGEKRENPEGEDCVRMGEKGGPEDLNCWSDKSCDEPQRIICEKQALNWI
ncbi:asialoglycoprotein receptor 1-like isoform X1 [Thunnus albacares]|uniref:asialoglycoprotein receptor 1-like isoform X1 n=1 Tax=Thunnus albacares TaxID=8236 RepID=UPI001CF6E621|nr:asialoglycoprotein receptor 1-like isoform X1 [Thunnus albacares]